MNRHLFSGTAVLRTSLFVLVFLFYTTVCSPAFAGAADLLWRMNTGGRIRSRPAVGPDGSIYVISEDRHLYAMTGEGRISWKYWLRDRVWDSLAVGPDGTVFTVTRRGILIAVNPGGIEVWRVPLGDAPAGDPAVDARGRVYVATVSGTLTCVSHRGTILWKADVPSAVDGAPVIGIDGAVMISCLNGMLYAFTGWGAPLWNSLLAGPPVAPAVSTDGTVYSGTRYGSLVAIDREGTILWDYVNGSPSLNPIITSEGILAAFEDGELTCLDAGGGTVWSVRIAGGITGNVAVSRGDVIHVFSSRGRLVLVGGEGVYLGTAGIEGRTPNFILSPDGKIVFGEPDWLVYAYTAPPPADSGWPQAGSDSRHSGVPSGSRIPDFDSLYAGDMDYLYVRHLSSSENPDDRLAVLREISLRLSDGSYESADDYLLYLVQRMIGDGVTATKTENRRVINDFPQVRIAAAGLLAIHGDLRSRETLVSVLENEHDPAAAAAEIAALASIGSDVDGAVVNAIARRVYADTSPNPDQSLAVQSVYALGAIRRYHGVLPEEGIRLLLHIYRGKYPRAVRDEALSILK